ncbi:VOC family protein [Flavobacterium sp.]|uniref:VOC family protein n=1 Tax=Flavobacterium sp. TaxID=239 RepID=UPI002B4B7769|nr:VOC family protein [Flavobacterium sp.]HLP63113.1 VOC family protein [Flavobacterium sp.]
METYKLKFLAVLLITTLMGCGNSQQNSDKNSKMGAASDSTSTEASGSIKQKITPCLWVDKDAKAVANYYLSIFKDGKLKEYHKYKNPPQEKGQEGQDSFETAVMEIGDIEFSILAAGPYFKFNESVSFVINCKDQAEVDYYWDALTANGGEEGSCGWCKDKYGLSWQVVPVEYFDLINSDDPKVREKAMKNTFTQKKILLSELK